MVLVKSWPFSHLLISGNIGPQIVYYDSLERKNCLSRLQKQELKKVEKLRFFQRGSSMVFDENWPFLHLSILGNIGPPIVFYNTLERKNAFLGYTNKKFKNSKNWHFSKGGNPWFWSKNGYFSNFFF